MPDFRKFVKRVKFWQHYGDARIHPNDPVKVFVCFRATPYQTVEPYLATADYSGYGLWAGSDLARDEKCVGLGDYRISEILKEINPDAEVQLFGMSHSPLGKEGERIPIERIKEKLMAVIKG